jgi:hypothetical protein
MGLNSFLQWADYPKSEPGARDTSESGKRRLVLEPKQREWSSASACFETSAQPSTRSSIVSLSQNLTARKSPPNREIHRPNVTSDLAPEIERADHSQGGVGKCDTRFERAKSLGLKILPLSY